jgi:hypothetical protein
VFNDGCSAAPSIIGTITNLIANEHWQCGQDNGKQEAIHGET